MGTVHYQHGSLWEQFIINMEVYGNFNRSFILTCKSMGIDHFNMEVYGNRSLKLLTSTWKSMGIDHY